MPLLLSNAFSLSMLPGFAAPGGAWRVNVRSMSLDEARAVCRMGFDSVVGHEPTAAELSTPEQLGVAVAYNRVAVTMQPGQALLVAQFNGGRLPEGVTVLPKNKYAWLMVELLPVFGE